MYVDRSTGMRTGLQAEQRGLQIIFQQSRQDVMLKRAVLGKDERILH